MNQEPEQENTYCCELMRESIEYQCDQHPNPFDCPDKLVYYSPKFDEYGIIVHDGGSSFVSITFCPWCGSKLPESKRDRWFEELKLMGFDDPYNQDIPHEYTSSVWYRQESLPHSTDKAA